MKNENLDLVVGVDETGVGDYFTPIVSVACIIKEENLSKVLELGIKDSKKLTDKKIEEIYPELIKLVSFTKTIMSQKGYNNLIDKYLNNNEIKTLIHSNSINRLLRINKLKDADVLIDQYVFNDETLEKHFEKIESIDWMKFSRPNANILLMTKAEDKSLSVAAASVIARKLLLDWMKEQEQKWELNFPLGASDKVIETCITFIKKYGKFKLNEVAKVSFKTTNKALEQAENQEIE
ncbi:ribonuclease HII [Metamycoplasma subdolum]|uniref:Ribonuclease n=1 Tax=Metamycoplasma subdolum TaxID=92407 RepID=A0A3M0A448_9BACT|nr:ribonuclease HIII [Metamycoplasma subdolum]RMA77508.1 ribonuclease HII [Metamycoplasma subdolum]WPB50700.1 ribonuclease HIII [Metamycoplasma subdolum]